jgi:hypothetical protein
MFDLQPPRHISTLHETTGIGFLGARGMGMTPTGGSHGIRIRSDTVLSSSCLSACLKLRSLVFARSGGRKQSLRGHCESSNSYAAAPVQGFVRL